MTPEERVEERERKWDGIQSYFAIQYMDTRMRDLVDNILALVIIVHKLEQSGRYYWFKLSYREEPELTLWDIEPIITDDEGRSPDQEPVKIFEQVAHIYEKLKPEEKMALNQSCFDALASIMMLPEGDTPYRQH